MDCTSNTEIGAIGIRALGANALSSLPVIALPIEQFERTEGRFRTSRPADSFVSDFYVVNSGSSHCQFFDHLPRR